MILEIKDTLVSMDIITEYFCCDLDKCHGKCCIEGNAGAPVTLEEIAHLEDALDEVWDDLSASAQAVIDKQGVAYTDQEGDLVTSIVNGKDCVFTCYSPLSEITNSSPTGEHEGSLCCLCAIERARRLKAQTDPTVWTKPISCALYPIRVKVFSNGVTALNYNRWDICRDAILKGRELRLPVYKFLRAPLIRRFGQEWYDELCLVANEIEQQGLMP